MADVSAPAAPSAAPAPTTGTANSVESATKEILNTLPQDSKKVEAAAPEAAGDDVDDTGEDIGEETALTPAEKKKAEAAAKKAYKLKVAGKDIEVDESELLKRAQMGYSADEKWQEAAKMRKQMENFVQMLQRDPGKALEQMGFDVDKLAEERIQRRIEEMQKSPEQVERERIQRELEELKAEREREKTDAQEREKTRLQDQYAIEIENDIAAALDNNSFGFPKTPYVVKRIADTMILAVQEGIRTNNQKLKNITAKDVLPIVQDEIKRELSEMYATSPDDVFEQLVGKDRLNKYRKSKIKKPVKPASVADVKPTGTSELAKLNDEQSKAQKKMSQKDFFRNLGRK